MEKELSEKSTKDLITEMTYLDRDIDEKLFRYEQIRLELVKRYPQVADKEEFQKKVKKIKQ